MTVCSNSPTQFGTLYCWHQSTKVTQELRTSNQFIPGAVVQSHPPWRRLSKGIVQNQLDESLCCILDLIYGSLHGGHIGQIVLTPYLTFHLSVLILVFPSFLWMSMIPMGNPHNRQNRFEGRDSCWTKTPWLQKTGTPLRCGECNGYSIKFVISCT